MEEIKSSAKRLMELAGNHKKTYIVSVVLAVFGVACGMIPYFAIARIMLLLIEGETVLNTYLFGAVLYCWALR